jgi:hypothetical protein
MQPITYYIEETDQIKDFVELVGEYFEKLNQFQLWDLSMVLSYDLGQLNLNCKPFPVLNGPGFTSLSFTYSDILELGPDETVEQALAVLSQISRKTAKQLVLAIAAIAADSDQY